MRRRSVVLALLAACAIGQAGPPSTRAQDPATRPVDVAGPGSITAGAQTRDSAWHPVDSPSSPTLVHASDPTGLVRLVPAADGSAVAEAVRRSDPLAAVLVTGSPASGPAERVPDAAPGVVDVRVDEVRGLSLTVIAPGMTADAATDAVSEAVLQARGAGGLVVVDASHTVSAPRRLAAAGADLVLVAPTMTCCERPRTFDPDADGRMTLVARTAGPGSDAVLEVIASGRGVFGWRAGRVGDAQGPEPIRWRLPAADAVALDGAWWTPAPRLRPAAVTRPGRLPVSPSAVVDAAVGDVTGDGRAEIVVAHRRPFRTTFLNATRPRSAWVDARGRSAHVGLYDPRDLSEIWVAGTLVRPVARVAACDGALGVAYSRLDDPAVIATGAWQWQGFGFLLLAPLPGHGRPVCADVDGDGRLEPAVVERSPG